MPNRQLSRLLVCSVTSFLVIAGCSDGGVHTVPYASDGHASIVPGRIGSIDLRLDAVFGSGRALQTHLGAGLTAIVTTAGVAVIDDAGIQTLDTFEPGATVVASAIAPDGVTLAVATREPATIRAYDLVSRRRVATTVIPTTTNVHQLFAGFSDEHGIVATTDAGLIRWTDPSTAEAETPVSNTIAAGDSALLPDGRLAVGLAESETLAIIGEGSPLEISLVTGKPIDVVASPDGAVLGVTTTTEDVNSFERTDSIVTVDTATLEPIGAIRFDRRLDSNSWTITDNHVVVVDGDIVTTYELDGSPSAPLPSSLEADVVDVIANDGGLAGVHRQGGLTLWHPDDGDFVGMILDPGQTPQHSVTTVGDLSVLAATDDNGRVRLWDLVDGSLVLDESAFEVGEATSVAVDDGRVAIGATTGRVVITDQALHPQSTVVVTDRPERVDTVEFAPSTGELAVGLAERLGTLAFDDELSLRKLGDDTPRFAIGGDGEDVSGCSFFYHPARFTPDGTLLANTSHDFTVDLIDVEAGTVVHTFRPEPAGILDVAFTADGQYLVVAADGSHVSVWRVDDYTLATEYEASVGGYQAIAMLATEPATMAVIDIVGTVTVVDALTGTPITTFEGGVTRTTNIDVSPDGSLLAAPSDRGGLTIWRTDTGQIVSTAMLHQMGITDIAFTDDGSGVLTSSRDGTVRRWSLVPSD